MDKLELGRLLARHGLRLRKSWSQNFLLDDAVAEAAIEGARPEGEAVIELGAGLGMLTSRLARTARRVIAVEKDARLARALRSVLAGEEKVEVLEQNAARIDFAALRRALGDRPVVVGNLPYHMAAPILFCLLRASEHLKRWVLMLQKEMADRVLAGPGGRERGTLGLMVENRARAERVLDVGADAFYPRPRVRSSILRFVPLAAPRLAPEEEAWFANTIRAAFSRRRKKIKNSLAALVPAENSGLIEECLLAAGVGAALRPEELSFDQFAAISRFLARGLGWPRLSQ